MVRSDSKIDEDWERKLREMERREYGERERKKKERKMKGTVGVRGSASYLFMLLQW